VVSASFNRACSTKQSRRTKRDISAIRAAILDVIEDDPPMTVRQVFYQLVARGVGSEIQQSIEIFSRHRLWHCRPQQRSCNGGTCRQDQNQPSQLPSPSKIKPVAVVHRSGARNRSNSMRNNDGSRLMAGTGSIRSCGGASGSNRMIGLRLVAAH
jgi:hypothetical protein